MKDVLPTLERWVADGRRVAVATVVATERSAPRDPGAVLAVSETGEVAGSVTGGCVEPAVYAEAREVLAGGEPRLRSYGIAADEALDVGLPCGGTVHVFVTMLDPALLAPLREAIDAGAPIGLVTTVRGPDAGRTRLGEALPRGESELVGSEFVASFVPPPRMYVFGAVDHAGAVARLGKFLGYRVTICDARARFATRERFPDVDELVVEWPDAFLQAAPVDARTAIVVLTHDPKFDVPALLTAVRTDAAYIGAMGSRRASEEREARLRAEGATDDQIARIHAPIGLSIGARSPEEVAVAIAAELIEATGPRSRAGAPEEVTA